MIITKKRLRKLPPLLMQLPKDTPIRAGIAVTEGLRPKLEVVGFPSDLTPGHTVLPSADLGPDSRFPRCRQSYQGPVGGIEPFAVSFPPLVQGKRQRKSTTKETLFSPCLPTCSAVS